MEEAGAGLQLSPNATRIGRDLGILDALRENAVELQRLRIRRGQDGADIAAMSLGDAGRSRYRSPFLVMHRADLQAVLVAAAGAYPTLSMALSTTASAADPLGAAVEISHHGVTRTCHGDGFVHAGGLRGGAGRDAGLAYSGKTAWRALVPAAALPTSLAAPHSNLWLGERAHVVHYPLRQAALVNVVVIVDEAMGPDAAGDFWAEPGDPGVLLGRLRGWHADLLGLVAAAPMWRKWPLFDGGPHRPWSRGRQTLVGDAAHPMLPFLAQGASQAFEDAAALADAVAQSDEIPSAFRLYERRRSVRAARVQEASRRQGRIYHLGGAAALARDMAMRLLGSERLMARMDWLYGDPSPRRP